jgi:hypothetical protein
LAESDSLPSRFRTKATKQHFAFVVGDAHFLVIADAESIVLTKAGCVPLVGQRRRYERALRWRVRRNPPRFSLFDC